MTNECGAAKARTMKTSQNSVLPVLASVPLKHGSVIETRIWPEQAGKTALDTMRCWKITSEA